MNVFILTDLEGIAGVDTIDCMDRTGGLYQQARRALVDELNLACKVCQENGAQTVYYLDGHGGGGNIIEAEVDPALVKCSLAQWQQLLRDGAIDCQIEIGCHARPGTIGGFLDHTTSSRSIYRHCINGKEYSELGLHALLCGRYNVPIVFCSGDEVACQQAKEYVPEIFTAAVKKSEVRNTAVTYPDAKERLSTGLAEALKNYKSVRPCRLDLPADISVTYYRTDMCEVIMEKLSYPVNRPDARTLQKTIHTLEGYWDLRF